MIWDEGYASPGSLRILLVKGDSMEPEMAASDRLLVNLSKRVPVTGEMFVLLDGMGLVVKRVQPLPGGEDGPARVRLVSANPDYEPYTCRTDDVHVVGKVVWVLGRIWSDSNCSAQKLGTYLFFRHVPPSNIQLSIRSLCR